MNIDSPTNCDLKLINGDYYLCAEDSDERMLISPAQAEALQAISKPSRLRTILQLTLIASLILLAIATASGPGIYI